MKDETEKTKTPVTVLANSTELGPGSENKSNQATISPWYTAQEAADYLKISIKTIYNLKCKGTLNGCSIGGKKGGALRFLKQHLDDLFSERKKGA